MKRIATVGAIVTAFAVAPTVAAAGNVVSQTKPQNHKAQVVDVQIARVQRAQAASLAAAPPRAGRAGKAHLASAPPHVR